MEGEWRGDEVVVGGNARQQFYDTRGYGTPLSGNSISLAPVEAAYLLHRGDLTTIDGESFPSFFASYADRVDRGVARFLTYCDFRSRGFHLTPVARSEASDSGQTVDFLVFERGSDPHNATVGYRVRVVGERDSVQLAELGDMVLAVVDAEGEVSYFDTEYYQLSGVSTGSAPSCTGSVIDDRVFVWDPPPELYSQHFFGQPFIGTEDPTVIQLSLIEAIHLVDTGTLVLTSTETRSELLLTGQMTEAEQFNRRLAVYRELRSKGAVPKTGFKFGADFRVYESFSSVDDMGHSELLVQVLPHTYTATPQEVALEVRLAHGVRKRTIFALTDGTDEVNWLAVSRLTP